MRAPSDPPQLPGRGGFLVPKRVLCTWASLPEHDQACVVKPSLSWLQFPCLSPSSVLHSCAVQWALKHQPSRVLSCFPRDPRERTPQPEGRGGAQAGLGEPCLPRLGSGQRRREEQAGVWLRSSNPDFPPKETRTPPVAFRMHRSSIRKGLVPSQQRF